MIEVRLEEWAENLVALCKQQPWEVDVQSVLSSLTTSMALEGW